MVELMTENTDSNSTDRGAEVIDRILRRGERAAALGADDSHGHQNFDGDQLELEERAALRKAGFAFAHLGDRILRVEAAALVGGALMLAHLRVWEKHRPVG